MKHEISQFENLDLSLADQFENSENLLIHGKDFKVVDIIPKQIKSEIPTIMVPGFSATPEALKDAILRTAEAGRRVISAYAPHGVEYPLSEQAGKSNKKSDLPEMHERKLQLLLKLIEAKNLGPVNIIANSEAASIVTAAAYLYPEKFRNIVLVEPAGLIGEDNFFSLVIRFLKDMKEEKAQAKHFKRAEFPSPASVGIKSVLSDIPGSAREVQAIAKSDITKFLEEIHKSGVGISIIHGVDDKLFPMDKVQKMTKEKMIDGFYSVKGSHNMIYSYEPFGRLAETALTDLEKKSKK
ncbi:MAG TPA: hypothetical protein VF974_05240 [Patescibacteria group bacterium]